MRVIPTLLIYLHHCITSVLALDELMDKIVNLQPVNFPSRLMRHRNHELWIDESENSDLFVKDSSFRIVRGLSGKGISFQSINFPDHYIRHFNFKVYLNKNDNSDLFKLDASFNPRREEKSFSFQSVNFPDHFIRHYRFRVIMSENDGSDQFNKDASWNIISKLIDF